MARRSVEKVVAAQLLESVKAAGNHLSRLRIESAGSTDSANAMQGAKSLRPEAVMDLYSRVRRIRDHLRRCVGAYPAQVEIDFGVEDSDLLVSCIIFYLEGLQTRIVSPETRRADRPWLQENANALAEEAVLFASKRVALLPNPFGKSPTTGVAVETARKISEAHEDRVRADLKKSERAKSDPFTVPSHAGGFGGSNLEESGIEKITLEPMIPGAGSNPASETPPASPAKVSSTTADPSPQVPAPTAKAGTIKAKQSRTPQSSVDEFASELEDSNGVPSQLAASAKNDEPTPWTMFLDPRHIRDPRLRGIMLLDLRALVRAVAAQDYRLAAVHLSSVLEGALVDHVMPITGTFDLKGTPNTWVLSDIVAKVYGGEIPARQRALFSQLIASRKLLLPAQQLHMPMVMTSSIFAELGTFVTEILARIGIVGNVQRGAPVARMPKRPSPAGQ